MTAGYIGRSADGQEYKVGSEKGVNWINSAKAGETMTGGDQSTWTKNADGSTSIVQKGITYTVPGSTKPVSYLEPIVFNSADGKQYSVGSQKGQDWINSAAAGDSITQSDGSVWTRNADGTYTIQHKGTTFNYGSAPAAAEPAAQKTPSYGDMIDQTMQGINDKSYSFDPETNEAWKAYKKQYTRLGQRSMADTMGAAAANTGGRASSYAVTAGNQAYSNYMAQAVNQLPTIEQNEYNRYLNELENEYKKIDMYRTLQADEEAKETAAYERELEAQKYADEQEQQRLENIIKICDQMGYVPPGYADDLNVPAYTKTDSAAYHDATISINQAELDEKKREYDSDLGYKYSALAEDKRQADQDAYVKLVNGSKSGSEEDTTEDLNVRMDKAGITSEAQAKSWLIQQGYKDNQLDILWTAYQEYLTGQTGEMGAEGTNDPNNPGTWNTDFVMSILAEYPGSERTSLQTFLKSGLPQNVYDQVLARLQMAGM